MNIEPLEARIAPAAIVSFIDIDGDLVTVTTSKGTNAQLAQLLSLPGALVEAGFGFRLEKIDFSFQPVVFDGTDLTITAAPRDLDPADGKSIKSGDGFAGVGFIDASSSNGGISINLGKITIDGDLFAIAAGIGVATAPAVKSLTVQSVGELRYSGNNSLSFNGSLGALTVKANLRGASIAVTGDLGPLTIGGSLIGMGFRNAGYIDVTGNIGAVKILGNLMGGTGSVDALLSGTIEAEGNIASVSIGGYISGGSAARAGSIFADGTIGPVIVKGSVFGGTGRDTGVIGAQSNLGNVTIGGSLTGASGSRSGSIFTENTGATIGAVKILGDVMGGSDAASGIITTDGDIKSVSIGGSLSALTAGQKGVTSEFGKIGSVTIGHDVKNSRIRASSIGAVTIGGSVLGGGVFANTLSSVKVVGDLIGGSAVNTGVVAASTGGSVSIGGSIVGGTDVNSGFISFVTLGSVTVGGDLIGGTAISSGVIGIGSATSIKIRGDVQGTDDVSTTGYIQASGQIKTLSIGGGLYGGDNTVAGLVEKTGSIRADRLGSVTIGGSVIAGRNQNIGNANDILRESGWIVAGHDIGSAVVKGSFVGNINNRARIYVRGLDGDPVANNLALKSLTIGGTVSLAWIFAGVGTSGEEMNGNAQVGAVKVGGDWIDSSLAAGTSSIDGILGDGNDQIQAGGINSKIASIVIKGQVLGGSSQSSATSGFVARQIGSFKSGGVTAPLTAGAGTDTFAAGKALAVGPSQANPTATKPDLFAVHVFEV